MKTVLVVDDAQTIRTAISWTLRGPDFKVLEAEEPDSAWRLLEQHRPDLVLVDVALGTHDGFGLCRDIKASASSSSTPVLLMTSALDPVDQSRAESSRADGHVKKPFDTQTLIDVVRTHLRLPLQEDTPLSYAGRLARKRALADVRATPETPPPIPVDLPPPPQAPSVPSRPPTEVEAIEIEAEDVESDSAVASTESVARAGPSLEPPPPPSAPSKVDVDVWALADDGRSSEPPRRSPTTANGPALTSPRPVTSGSPPPLPPATPSDRVHRAAARTVSAVAQAGAEGIARAAGPSGLAHEELRALAREVLEKVAWEVVPDLAETIIREELARLTAPDDEESGTSS
ncbi:MAG: response regulator [Myxococcota bacterium]